MPGQAGGGGAPGQPGGVEARLRAVLVPIPRPQQGREDLVAAKPLRGNVTAQQALRGSSSCPTPPSSEREG